MKVSPTGSTVINYYNAMRRKEVIVNREYQRSAEVWPLPARAFLIETIILGYPVPKLALYPKTDLTTRMTVSEIVDGQQRSMAIRDFIDNKFPLPKKSPFPFAGQKCDDLDDDVRRRFFEYRLAIDEFTDASQLEIREMFRRMNAYNVSLNPEEKRHSDYQGEFKWFVYRFCEEYGATFSTLNVLSERNLARMGDAKMVTDVILACLDGTKTTKAKDLDELYKRFDPSFPGADALGAQLAASLNELAKFEELRETKIFKGHVFYSLWIAVLHAMYGQPGTAADVGDPGGSGLAADAEQKLSRLAALLDEDPDSIADPTLKSFVLACGASTNVKDVRLTRLTELFKAVRA